MIAMAAPTHALAIFASEAANADSARAAAISALKSSISVLESSIRLLETDSPTAERIGYCCAFAVAVGVALEILGLIWGHREESEDLTRCLLRPTTRPSKSRFRFEITATILVTLGVMGEAGTSAYLASVNSQLRSKTSELRADSDQLLALITLEAGDAKTSAVKARDAAVKANEAAEKLEQRLAWRHISPAKFKQYRSRLKPFAGFEVDLGDGGGGDTETTAFCEELKSLFLASGWKVGLAEGGRGFRGIEIYSMRDKAALVLSSILKEMALTRTSVELHDPAKPSMSIFVGMRPAP